MKTKKLKGREIDLNQKALDELRMRLKGPVVLPGDAGYDDLRTVWNAMVDKKPAIIARCLGGEVLIVNGCEKGATFQLRIPVTAERCRRAGDGSAEH